ncbi:HTH_Tnp_Tc3_2 domain-containing protein [Trichonephila clavipes]|nr:HTH_Tnp_Tc3_2 domain-containing protein [Trichonephila clavipes]
MPHLRCRNAYQHVSDFDKGRIVPFRDFCLSYRCVATRVGQNPMTFSRIWNRWFQDGNMERRAGWPSITSSREGKYVTSMAFMSRAATTRALSQELGFVCKTSVCTISSTTFAAAWTFISETKPEATLEAASQTGASSMLQDGRICVWAYRGELTLSAYIRHRHTGPSNDIMHLIPSATLRRFINSKASRRSCIIMPPNDEQLADPQLKHEREEHYEPQNETSNEH